MVLDCEFLQIWFGLKYCSIFFPHSNSILQGYLVTSLMWTSRLRRVLIRPISSAQTNTTSLYSWWKHCWVTSLFSCQHHLGISRFCSRVSNFRFFKLTLPLYQGNAFVWCDSEKEGISQKWKDFFHEIREELSMCCEGQECSASFSISGVIQ